MKKLLSIFLVVMMLVSVIVIPANAAEDTYVGYSAARVDKVDATKMDEMTNIKDYATDDSVTEYKITDEEGLKYVATLVNNKTTTFKGETLYLANNIDLGYEGSTATGSDRWIPIGTNQSGKYFAGTFDGQGYTINRLFVRQVINTSGWVEDAEIYGTSYTTTGFIGCGADCTVKNLIIGPDSNLGVSGQNNGIPTRTGAIIGDLFSATAGSTSTIDNCYNAASLWGQNKTGGMVGYWYNNSKAGSKLVISNCTNVGTVTGSEAGGMIGESASLIEIKNCRNIGAVTKTNVGGMIGRARGANVNIENCINNATLTGSSNVGAMIGLADTSTNTLTLTNCANYGAFNKASNGRMNMWGGGSATLIDISGCVDYTKDYGYSADRVVLKEGIDELPNIKDYESNTSATEFQITDEAGMDKVATLVNNGNALEGVTLYIANNINMNGSMDNRWTPIGTSPSGKPFKGTIDGQGHTISGFYFYADADGSDQWTKTTYGNTLPTELCAGLVGSARWCTLKNIVIKDSSFTFEGASSSNDVRIGAFYGIIRGGAAIDNCYSEASVTGGEHTGGFVGYWYVQGQTSTSELQGILRITNSTNAGTVSDSIFRAGGFVAETASPVTMENCLNSGAISSNQNAAGFINRARGGNITLTECVNTGNITASNGRGAAIVVALDYNHILTDCANSGTISATTAGKDAFVSAPNANYTYSNDNAVDLTGALDYDASLDGTDLIRPDVNLTTVKDTLMFHGTQETAVDGGKYSVRFVGSIDSLDYSYVGMNVVASWDGGTQAYGSRASAVYDTVVAGTDSGLKKVDADQLRGQKGYLFAYTIENVPAELGVVTFTVTVYSRAVGAEYDTTHTSYTVTYDSGNFVSITANA